MEGKVYIGLWFQRIRVHYTFWLLVMSEVTVANESPAVSQHSQNCSLGLWFQSLRFHYTGTAWQQVAGKAAGAEDESSHL